MSPNLRIARLGVAAAAIGPLLLCTSGRCRAQEVGGPQIVRRYDLYIDANHPKNRRVPSKDGKEFFEFNPFNVQPRTIVNSISFNQECPASQLDKGATGTVCEFAFNFVADEWANIGFTPAGGVASTEWAIDLKRELALSENMPCYLRVDARTAPGKIANIEFKVGHGPGDSQRFPIFKMVTLNDKWQTVELDCTDRPGRVPPVNLTRLVSPFTIGIQAGNNVGPEFRTDEGVFVYLDNLRFEVRREQVGTKQISNSP